jgi:hypothetical protein
MRQNGTSIGVTPSAGGGSYFGMGRGVPKADFLSQLIAERHHLAPQRARRRAPVADALRTYDAGGHVADRRLPPGWRMNIEA